MFYLHLQTVHKCQNLRTREIASYYKFSFIPYFIGTFYNGWQEIFGQVVPFEGSSSR
jgi:hypothetical protein